MHRGRRTGSWLLLCLAALCSPIHVLHSGHVSLLGWVLAGALVAAWALTYARHVCAAQPLHWRALGRATSTGALVAPIVALAELLIGEPVWIAIGTAAILWVVTVTRMGSSRCRGQCGSFSRRYLLAPADAHLSLTSPCRSRELGHGRVLHGAPGSLVGR